MVVDPRIRASDDDRDKTASLLREHHAAGRLDAEEFNERLDKVFAAKTIGELDELLADLPGIDLYRLPDSSLRHRSVVPGSSAGLAAMASAGRADRHHGGRLSAGWAAAWGSWLTVAGIMVVIWALSGGGYPWFAWILGPWGIALLGRWISGGHPGGSGHGHGHGIDSRPDRGELPDDQDQIDGSR